jgi:hypothetical protein
MVWQCVRSGALENRAKQQSDGSHDQPKDDSYDDQTHHATNQPYDKADHAQR